MMAAILFTVSLAALLQFWVHYWRAMIAGVASQPVSERIRTAAGISSASISGQNFNNLLIIKDLTPELRGPGRNFVAIRAYYRLVEKLGSLVPAMADWSKAEMATCSRYVAVLMDQHLERNLACAEQMRGI